DVLHMRAAPFGQNLICFYFSRNPIEKQANFVSRRPPRAPPFFVHLVLLLVPIAALIRLPLGVLVRSALRFFLRQNELLLILPVIGVRVGLVFLGLTLLLPHFQPEVCAAGNPGQHHKYQHRSARTILLSRFGFRLGQRFSFWGGSRFRFPLGDVLLIHQGQQVGLVHHVEEVGRLVAVGGPVDDQVKIGPRFAHQGDELLGRPIRKGGLVIVHHRQVALGSQRAT